MELGNPNEIKEHLSICKPLVEDRRESCKYNPVISLLQGRIEACGLLSTCKHKGLEIQAKLERYLVEKWYRVNDKPNPEKDQSWQQHFHLEL